MRRAVLIYNPTSGRRRAGPLLSRVLEVLRAGGFEVEPLATAGPGDATRLARAAADDAIEIAFAMGGDGTLREAARGLLGTETALAPLPAGTTNVLAITLGLPGRALAAARVLPGCQRRAIDVGLAAGEPFLMQVSGGLDAAIMAFHSPAAKQRFGKGAVAWTGLRQWWAYPYPEIELRLAGRVERVGHFAACNIPHYAGPFKMAPEADLSDGLLDLVLFRGRSRPTAFGYARDLALGRHLRRADVDHLRLERFEIAGPPDVLLQLDGDVLAAPAPIEVSISPHRLWVLAPG